jgi:nucleoside-triphosphatase THEP1
MITFITVYHSGVVIINEIGSYEFVGMKTEAFLLNKFSTLVNVVHLVHERLAWRHFC